MGELKVGDIRIWKQGHVARFFTINYIGKTKCFFTYKDGLESPCDIDTVLKESIPYTPPTEKQKWFSVLYKTKELDRPIETHFLFKDKEDFLNHVGFKELDFEWVELKEACEV